MDHQQDLAVNTLTILDKDKEFGLTVQGNAVIKGSVKVHCNIHINNDIRTCGCIIPLSDTSKLGTVDNKWNTFYSTNGYIDNLTVGTINVSPTLSSTYEIICYTDTVSGSTFAITLTNTKYISILNLTGIVASGILTITINLPLTSGTTKKLVIVNPNSHIITINNTQLAFITYSNNNTYQTIEFLYDTPNTQWILIG